MEVFVGGLRYGAVGSAPQRDPRIARVENEALCIDAAFNRQLITLSWASLTNGTPADDDGGTVVQIGTASGTDVRYNVATIFVNYTGSSKIELWPMSSPTNTSPVSGDWHNMTGGDLSSGVDTRKTLDLLFDDGPGKYTAICRLCDGWFKLMACEQATGGGSATVKILFGKE